ncbi:MAG: CDGSH iron-sulfur domain-containing protein, partial [Acidimicrobiales bacterium]
MSDDYRVKVAEHGPYLVSGEVPLVTKTPVMSEHGEPLTWKTSEPSEKRARYALCRCGSSQTKPFCDGSHASVDWDSADNTTGDSYSDRANSLGGHGLEIFDDRPTCAHAGFCGN